MMSIENDVRDSAVSEAIVEEPISGTNETGSVHSRQLAIPKSVQPIKIDQHQLIFIVLLHILALLAFIPWFYSLTGFLTGIVSIFVFAMMGINIGYHRLLTHGGFSCPKWFEHTLALLGLCMLQGSPARWVAIHRLHHKYSDEQADPHSPFVSAYWGHIGWLFVRNREFYEIINYERYVRDLLRDRFYLMFEQNLLWFWIYCLHALLFFAGGYAVGWYETGTLDGSVQMGFSLLVWGVFVRTIFVLHCTWAVNSVSHLWGYQNYKTSDNSRNNWLVSLFAHGEGWHNNHHAEQMSASHGHLWYEFDLTWWVIWSLEKVGLVKNVVRPRCWKAYQESR